jgi:hypothetical protein
MAGNPSKKVEKGTSRPATALTAEANRSPRCGPGANSPAFVRFSQAANEFAKGVVLYTIEG